MLLTNRSFLINTHLKDSGESNLRIAYTFASVWRPCECVAEGVNVIKWTGYTQKEIRGMNTEEQIFKQLNNKIGNLNMTLELKLAKNWNYEKEEHLGGIRYIFNFENGFGASVVKFFGSYGANQDKWELAILADGEIVGIPSIIKEGEFVIGWLSDEEVETILEKIKAL